MRFKSFGVNIIRADMKRLVADGVEDFSGESICDVKPLSGIYAWFYNPRLTNRDRDDRRFCDTLASLLCVEHAMEVKIRSSYGIKFSSTAPLTMDALSDGLGTKASIIRALEQSPDLVKSFFGNTSIWFVRPLYIGISKDLYSRVYEQHYDTLCKYWDESSAVSQSLLANPSRTINDIMKVTGEKHSFALEARARGVQTRDLTVRVSYLSGIGELDDQVDGADSGNNSRDLEHLLHLLNLPICGRS